MADAENDDSMWFPPGEAFENFQSPPTTEDEGVTLAILPEHTILPLTTVSPSSAIASNGESLTQTPRHPYVPVSDIGGITQTLVHSPLPLNDEETPPRTIQSVSSLSSIDEAPSSVHTHVSISTTRTLDDQSSTSLPVTANDEYQLTVENSETANFSFTQGVFSLFGFIGLLSNVQSRVKY